MMARQRGLLLAIAAILLGSTGCLSCGHHCHQYARTAGPENDIPTVQRNGVYVFAMSSLNPVSMVALDTLREQLSQQGYAKVATGQTIHALWMASEMRRIHEDEPDAVFVVMGFESAASAASRLAEKAQAEGLPVAGVVVITSGETSATASPHIRTLAIGPGSSESGHLESVPVTDVASFGLATDTRTVQAIGRLLGDAAGTVPLPAVEEKSAWEYRHAPPMRPEGDPARDPNWVFLFDQGPRAAPSTGHTEPSAPSAPALTTVAPTVPTLRSAIR